MDSLKRFNAGVLRTYRILEQATRVCHAEGCVAQEAVNKLQAVMQQLDEPQEDDDPTGANAASALAAVAMALLGASPTTPEIKKETDDATEKKKEADEATHDEADEATHDEEEDETKEDDQ